MDVTEDDPSGGPAPVPLGPAVPAPACGGWTRQVVYPRTGTLSTAHGHDGREPVEITGAIRDKWYELGADRSRIGCPVRPEYPCADGQGRCCEFATAGALASGSGPSGVLVAAAGRAACALGEPIWRAWLARGATTLGFPVSDEFTCDDGVGRFAQFAGTRRSRIYHTPTGGLFVVGDPIYAAWMELGREAGTLGYPIADDHDDGTALRCRFEHGEIRWTDGGPEVVADRSLMQ